MSYTIPDLPPQQLTQGLTAKWYADPSDFPSSEHWTLSYRFAGPSSKTYTAAATGGRYLVTVSATNSAAMPEGAYQWQSYAASNGETYAVESGQCEVLRDFRTIGQGYDARSTAKQILDAVDASLLGTATDTQQSMSVDGRALSRYGISELLKLRDKYATIYASERNAARVAAGQPSTRNIRARFVSA